MLSWEHKQSADDGSGIKSVVVPSPEHDQRKGDKCKAASQAVPPPEEVSKKISDLGSVEARSPDEAIAEEASSRSEPEWAHEHDELLRAFLEGAGVPDLAVSGGLTPQFLNLIGQLLREATQGTLDLLLARTLTKREVRAELTMIAPAENNPLKFSPTVEVALAHLLAPQGRGFMAPRQAMKDAQDDLRSHQFGFMAGMRAALAGVLERFSPEELEQRLAQKTVIDSMLPFNRKAKLWDLFSERYKEISREAEEDFQVLFGREFLRAYQAQVAKLEQEKKK
jgi:FHA domain-containing protein